MKKHLLKKFTISLSVIIVRILTFPPAVHANAITESTFFKGIQKMINDASVALLLIAPIACGLLYGIFSLIQALATEQHDKDKWIKNKRTVLTILACVFGSSAFVAIITSYFA